MVTWAAAGHSGHLLLLGCRLCGSTASVLVATRCSSHDPTCLPQPCHRDDLLAVAGHAAAAQVQWSAHAARVSNAPIS